MIALYIVGAAWIIYLIYGIIYIIMDANKRKAYSEEIGHKATNKEWRAYKKQLKTKAKTSKKLNNTPVKTKILDHSNGQLVGNGGGVGRAIVGGAIAGEVGAIIGASTRKQKFTQKQYTIFRVWYQDGHDEVEKVEHGTAKYKRYLKLLED